MRPDAAMTSFDIKFRQPQIADSIHMDHINDNIYYAKVTLNSDQLSSKELKYSYIRLGVAPETLEQNELSFYDRTKGKKFYQLNTYFDFLEQKIIT